MQADAPMHGRGVQEADLAEAGWEGGRRSEMEGRVGRVSDKERPRRVDNIREAV